MALAIVSTALTIAVAISAVGRGHVSSSAPLGLICAVLLAAVAAAEASRPARRDRRRRAEMEAEETGDEVAVPVALANRIYERRRT